MKILITGGHHSSALPVIQKIRTEHPDTELFWAGHKSSLKGNKNTSLEYTQVTSLGIPFYNLKAGKLYKTKDIRRLLKIPLGFIHAFILLLKIRPNVILSFGGYLAAPVVVSGWVLGIPSVTHEQTVVAGYANKLIGKFAKTILISWESSRKFFDEKKIVFSGLPLRDSIFTKKSNSFEIKNSFPTIYITAGKTGSHIINTFVKESLAELLSFCNVIHQCGDNSVTDDFKDLSNIYADIDPICEGKYFLRKFVLEDEIGEAVLDSKMLVCRSGAHTSAEILALEKPALMIPIPWVSHNEQNKNADLLADLGLAKVLNEDTLTSSQFVTEIKDFLLNLSNYKLNKPASNGLINKEAASIIVNETFKASKKG